MAQAMCLHCSGQVGTGVCVFGGVGSQVLMERRKEVGAREHVAAGLVPVKLLSAASLLTLVGALPFATLWTSVSPSIKWE